MGMKISWIFFGVSTNWTVIFLEGGGGASFLCIKGLFLMPMFGMGFFLGVAKISNSFWVCLIFLFW